MSNASTTNRTCPSLGLMDDAETSLAFPSIWNCCYRGRPLAPPRLKYQEEFCLSEHHRECPLLLNEKAAPLPVHIRAQRSRVKRAKNTFQSGLLVFLIIMGVIFVLVWGLWSRGYLSPFGIEKATAIPSTRVAPAASDTPSPRGTASSSSPLTRTPTVLVVSGNFTDPTPAVQTVTPAEPISKHQLEVPLGIDHKFLIHRVLEGENLDQVAPKYDTSVEAIVAINHALKLPIWVGILVVIPIGFTDVADLPGFETYTITEAGMTVELLAQKLNIDAFDLKYYNSIGAGELLRVGDWLLIAHKKTVP